MLADWGTVRRNRQAVPTRDGADVEASCESVTVGIPGSACGDVGRSEYPAASVLAAGFARGLEVPTEAEVTEANGRANVAVMIRPAWKEHGVRAGERGD